MSSYRSCFWLPLIIVMAGCSASVSASKMEQIKPSMSVTQVKAILGEPAHIDQAETVGLKGELYHYPSKDGEGRVILLNDKVFRAEFVPGAKAT